MTFEEYERHYPEECRGCITMKLLYHYDKKLEKDYQTLEEDETWICGVVRYDDPHKCPCRKCIVKVTCDVQCEQINKLEEKIKPIYLESLKNRKMKSFKT